MTGAPAHRDPVHVSVVGPKPLLNELMARVLTEAGFTTDASAAPVVIAVHESPARLTVAPSAVAMLVVPAPLSDAELLASVSAGALAVVHDHEAPGELARRTATLAAGDAAMESAQVAAMSRALRAQRAEPPKAVTLTGRERDLLVSMEAGQSVKQTARSLGISIKTVENTQRLLFRKLDVRNRAQAVARTHELGLLRPADPAAEQPEATAVG